jgi:hypothetical protein
MKRNLDHEASDTVKLLREDAVRGGILTASDDKHGSLAKLKAFRESRGSMPSLMGATHQTQQSNHHLRHASMEGLE